MTVQLLITSGKGPVECRAAVGHVLGRMQAEAEALGIGFDQVSRPGDGGPISAIVALHGGDAAVLAAQWCGTVQWVAESRFRQGHRRKNWFVGVFAMTPEPSATVLDLADVRVETCRAGGPGGQHVNTTDSAVRMVHLPTGLAVIARDGRSQIQNRKVAQERLGRLLDLQRRLLQAENQRLEHELHQGLVRGNPRRRFHGPQFSEMV